MICPGCPLECSFPGFVSFVLSQLTLSSPLCWSQDIVEGELLNEIAARSDSFFEAARSLQELHMSLEETLEHIAELRTRMASVDRITCAKAARVKKLHVHRANLKEVTDIVQVELFRDYGLFQRREASGIQAPFVAHQHVFCDNKFMAACDKLLPIKKSKSLPTEQAFAAEQVVADGFLTGFSM